MTSRDKQGHGHHIRSEGGRYWARQRVTEGTAIIYDVRVEDIGSDDVLEMLYEPYTRIDSGDHFKG